MGAFKETQGKKVENINEMGKEAVDTGTEMGQEADGIDSVLESLNLKDTDDAAAVEKTEEGYQKSFDNAFDTQVESENEKIQEEGQEVSNEVGAERENVSDSIQKVESAEGMSDIGKDVAQGLESNLESSEKEYEGIQNEEEKSVSDTKQKVDALKKKVGSAFG